MFVDRATIEVCSGDGGDGCLSFRREKHVPRGGPDGGDGGRGGSVVFEVDGQLRTLLDLRYRRFYRAENGGRGQGSNMHGKDGRDIIIRVPPGTVLSEADSGRQLADLVDPGDSLILLEGGIGGKGNARFKSSTHQTPTRTTPGRPGSRTVVELTLKLIADVGLVGEPNAGKSTLLSKVSAARPKIAPYPFTTLEPHLGVVRAGGYASFLMVDIPGLIEGAHSGKGLGKEFLRHVERTRILCFLIDASRNDRLDGYRKLLNEIEQYDMRLLEKPRVVVLTKIDLMRNEGPDELEGGWPEDVEIHSISSVTGTGVDRLVRCLWSILEESLKEEDTADEG